MARIELPLVPLLWDLEQGLREFGRSHEAYHHHDASTSSATAAAAVTAQMRVLRLVARACRNARIFLGHGEQPHDVHVGGVADRRL